MRALCLSLLRFAPLPLALVLVNLLVDPVRLTGGDEYEHRIARLLLAGHGVTNIANPKDEAVVQSVIEGLQHGPEVIVLGSSRSKLIRSRFFGTERFFNNSVAGGGLTDYLALYRLYRQRDFAPRLIVIEVSPWVLEPAYASIWEDRYPRRRDLERELFDDRPIRRVWDPGVRLHLERLKEIVSPGYFQISLMSWMQRVRLGPTGDSWLPFEPGDVPLKETVLPDGSAVYGEIAFNEAERRRVRVQAIAYTAVSTGVPRAIERGQVALLEAFVRRIQRDGAKVVLYFPPYHPEAYDRMVASRENALLPDVERTLRALAMRTASTTIGSFDPRAIGFGEDDFFDPVHSNADAIARLFAGRWAAGDSAAGSGVRIVWIINPNGVETLQGRPFFWIGQGAACISLKGGAVGWARLSFSAAPGPSLPQTQRRRLLVTSTASRWTQVVSIDTAGQLSVVVPVAAGVTDICFTSLDSPTVTRLVNGDMRPLILSAAAPRVEAAPAPAAPQARAPCRVTFGGGWYQPEVDAAAWLRWMSGPSEIIISADAPGAAVLTGNAIAITPPDRVDISIGDTAVGGIDISGKDGPFHPFMPLAFHVTRGDTRLALRPANPPVTPSSDPRRLAVALQNLNVTMDGAVVPCDLRP